MFTPWFQARGGHFNFYQHRQGGEWLTSWQGWGFSSYKAGGFWWYKNSFIWIGGQIFEFWRNIFDFWRYILNVEALGMQSECKQKPEKLEIPNSFRYKIGTTNEPWCWVPVWRDHMISSKTVENSDNYSKAPKRKMRRSASGNLVQWVNL